MASFSQGWLFATESNGSKYYVRKYETNERYASNLKYWEKQVSDNLKYIDGQGALQNYKGYSITLIEYNTKNKKFKYLSLVCYNTKGQVLHTDDYNSDWYDTYPDSVGEYVQNFAETLFN